MIKHPINKNSISLTSKIVCSYMRVFTVVLLISYNNIIHSRQDGVINREKVYSKSLLGLGDRAFKPERWHIKDVQFKLEPDSRGLLFLK